MNSYRREVEDVDGARLQVETPGAFSVNQGKIRVITDPSSGRPVWFSIEQARAAHEALAEAIFAAELQQAGR